MDTSVSMIEVDTGKSFDIATALNSIRMEYEKSVQQHREEADAYYKIKVLSRHLASQEPECVSEGAKAFKLTLMIYPADG